MASFFCYYEIDDFNKTFKLHISIKSQFHFKLDAQQKKARPNSTTVDFYSFTMQLASGTLKMTITLVSFICFAYTTVFGHGQKRVAGFNANSSYYRRKLIQSPLLFSGHSVIFGFLTKYRSHSSFLSRTFHCHPAFSIVRPNQRLYNLHLCSVLRFYAWRFALRRPHRSLHVCCSSCRSLRLLAL